VFWAALWKANISEPRRIWKSSTFLLYSKEKEVKEKGKRKKKKKKKKQPWKGKKKGPFQVEYRTQSQVSESTVQNFCRPSAETNTDSLFVISWNLSPPTSPLFQHLPLQTSLHLT